MRKRTRTKKYVVLFWVSKLSWGDFFFYCNVRYCCSSPTRSCVPALRTPHRLRPGRDPWPCVFASHKRSVLSCSALIAAFKMSRLIQTVPECHTLTHLHKTNQPSSGCSGSDLVFMMWSGLMLLVLVWNRRNHPKCDTWTCRVPFLQALECKPSGMQQIAVKETASACPSVYLSGCLPVCIA